MERVLRRAKRRDQAALLAIEAVSFPTDRIKPRQMGYLISRAKAQVWVVEEGADILGYAILLTPERPRRARIYSLAVAQQVRGQGIGRLLLKTLQSQALQLGFSAIALEVRCSALKVQALYQRFGFRWTHLISGYYADGEDGWKMVCPLPPPDWAEDAA